jgi:hypothetical protein
LWHEWHAWTPRSANAIVVGAGTVELVLDVIGYLG